VTPGPVTEARSVEALRQERDFLLASLRDLEAELADGEISPEDHRALRDGYTARAAEVLRLLGEAETPADTPAAAPADGGPASPPRSRRRLRTVVAVAGALFFAGGVAFVAAGMAGWRSPGQTITGSVAMTPDQELAAARVALANGDSVGALRLYDAVLRADPHQVEALAYRGWLLREAGNVRDDKNLLGQALASERDAVAIAPGYPDAHFFLGVMLLDDQHDAADAVPQLEAYLASNPPAANADAVKAVLARARQEAGSAAGA